MSSAVNHRGHVFFNLREFRLPRPVQQTRSRTYAQAVVEFPRWKSGRLSSRSCSGYRHARPPRQKESAARQTFCFHPRVPSRDASESRPPRCPEWSGMDILYMILSCGFRKTHKEVLRIFCDF